MLVPAPPEVDARQTSGFIVKHDQTSIWKTISAETNFTCTNHVPIVCVALLGETQLKTEFADPALARGIPKVVALNAGTRVFCTDIKVPKESSGQRPRLSPFPRAANGQTIASHRERYRKKKKQTGPACLEASQEPTHKGISQQ